MSNNYEALHSVVEHFSVETMLNSLLVFGWFFWSWHETSGYFDNHGNDSTLNIGIINVQMVLTGIAAIFIPEAIEGNYQPLILAFLPIELMLIFVWYTISRFDKAHGPASRVWAQTYIGVSIVLISSVLAGASFKFWLMVIALKREYALIKMPYTLKDSLIERYGLMTMIALGEMISGLYTRLNGVKASILFEFIMGIVLAALISAIYYQVIGELHIQLKTSIQVMVIRWLFLLDIYLLILNAIFLQLLFARGTLMIKVFFIIVLFASLLLMWVIQRLTTQQVADNTAGFSFFTIEFLVLIFTVFLPVTWMLGLVNLILLVINIRYRHKINQGNEVNH